MKTSPKLSRNLKRWNALRDAAGPGSAIWHQKPLEEQQEKLDQLQHFLTRLSQPKEQLPLAQWLSSHFFECCFQTTTKIKMDGGRKEAEAHANLYLVEEEHGQLEKGAKYYEAFYHLTVDRIWKDETSHSHNSLACENLWRIYTLQADKMLVNKQCQKAIKTLVKAFDLAREGDNEKLEGEAAYRLGLAHISSVNPHNIFKYILYMKISKMLEDNVSLGKVYKAIAKGLER
ncbi:tetratricopeptide repeat protein 29 [Xenopus laevis]|uniref:Tetratricopeptide repeat protein 29 n=1 Tax=Xenopus laevis TaxID=8355 RepID=A0A8J1LWH4_XENLA|nr:tetratricopeptide repeat protein 29 [Xenopus laevis]